MTIRNKITWGFVSAAVMVGVLGYVAALSSQKALHDAIGGQSAVIAGTILDDIDRGIFKRMQALHEYNHSPLPQKFVSESNREFAKLDDAQAYIKEMDLQWQAAEKDQVTPFMQALLDNELSEELRKRAKFYEKEYGYNVLAEISMTNKYGVNVGLTSKTSDYYQGDKHWWTEGKERTFCVGPVGYDQDAGVYSIDVCVKIDDGKGAFLGVTRAVLNMAEIVNTIQWAHDKSRYQSTSYSLLTEDGKVIYDTKPFEMFEPAPKEVFAAISKAGDDPYFISENSQLVAHAHSRGYRDVPASGWIFIVKHDTAEVFAAATRLKNRILLTSIMLVALAILIGAFVSRTISNRIASVSAATTKIGTGDLDARIEIVEDDEIADLARSVNTMASNLKDVTASRTELRQAQQKLKETNLTLAMVAERSKQLAAEATRANQAKSDFLANMSHEIRTPMNSIVGFTDLLSDEHLTHAQEDFVAVIRDSAQQLLRLIDDILDISKIEAEKIECEMVECSLEEIMTEIDLFHPAAAEKQLEFKVLHRTKLPVHIRTDPMRLRQCLTNLVSNAIKFTEKGHVHVAVSLESRNNAPFVRFDVEDTGIGIPAHKQEQIFSAFSQVDSSATRQYGGTGLGLAIAKRLADALGGGINLRSHTGKGSVFSLFVPVGMPFDDADLKSFFDEEKLKYYTPEPLAIGGSHFSGSVLVAEDNPSNRVMLEITLERMGLTVTSAQDGRQALDMTADETFDLIFMDMQMPIMSGYESTRAMRKQGLTTPIIALTAHAMKDDQDKCLAAGCDAYLTKPVNRNELQAVLHQFLHRVHSGA